MSFTDLVEPSTEIWEIPDTVLSPELLSAYISRSLLELEDKSGPIENRPEEAPGEALEGDFHKSAKENEGLEVVSEPIYSNFTPTSYSLDVIEHELGSNTPGSSPEIQIQSVSKLESFHLQAQNGPVDHPQLTKETLLQCKDIWSYSSIFSWLSTLPSLLKHTLFDEYLIKGFLHSLIVFYYPKLEDFTVGTAVDAVFEAFVSAKVLVEAFDLYFIDEEASVSGVLPMLTPCYSTAENHFENSIKYSCYDGSCQYTEKTVWTDLSDYPTGVQWDHYWGLGASDLAKMRKSDINLQSIIFELITHINKVYNDYVEFYEQCEKDLSQNSTINKTHRLRDLLIGPLEKIVMIQQEHLVEPLKEVLKTQKKRITHGYSEPISNWLDQASEYYEQDLINKVRLACILEFEALQDSQLYQWEKAFRARQHGKFDKLFKSYFLQLSGVKNIVERLYTSLVKYSQPSDHLKQTLDKLEQFCVKLNGLQKSFETAEYLNRIKGGEFVFSPKEATQFHSRLIAKGINDEHLVIFLFTDVILVTRRDVPRHRYILQYSPILARYAYAVPSRSSRVRSVRNSISSIRTEPKQTTRYKIKAVNTDTKIYAFTYEKIDNTISTLRRTARTTASVTFLGRFEDLPGKTRSQDDIFYDSDAVKCLEACSMTYGSVLSTCSVEYKGAKFLMALCTNGVKMCVEGGNTWVNVSGLHNGRKIRFLAQPGAVALLIGHTLYMVDFERFIAGTEASENVRMTTIGDGDVIDFCEDEQGSSIAYITKDYVGISVITSQKLKILEKPKKKYKWKKLNLTDSVEKVFIYGPQLFVTVKGQGFLRIQGDALTLIPNTNYFKCLLESALDDSLKEIARRFQRSEPVGIFPLESEYLVVLKEIALVCGPTGSLSRSFFLEFGMRAVGATFKDRVLNVIGPDSVEVYIVEPFGPKIGALSGVFVGNGLRDVGGGRVMSGVGDCEVLVDIG